MELALVDVHDFDPGRRVDSVWLDIWPDRTLDNYDEVKALMARARNRWCKKGKGNRWVGAWYFDDLRRMQREERREEREAQQQREWLKKAWGDLDASFKT